MEETGESLNGTVPSEAEIVANNLGLVRMVLKRLLVLPEEADDLFQAGAMGLFKAARRFDPNRGVRFSTFAVATILGEVRRERLRTGSFHLGRRGYELVRRARQAAAELRGELQAEPTVAEIAARMGEAPEEVIRALEEEPSAAEAKHTADSAAHLFTEGVLLRQALRELPPELRRIVFRRYFRDETQAEVARVLGTTQVRVHRLEQKALRLLREALAE